MRLCLRGFQDREGASLETYAGTASLSLWRSLIVIVCQGKGSVGVVDVKEAFTQSEENDSRGFQTNNPGFPGFAHDGWLFGTFLSLSVEH